MIPSVTEKVLMLVVVLAFVVLAVVLRSPVPLVGAMLTSVVVPVAIELRKRKRAGRSDLNR